MTKVAFYLRVSTNEQTTENQRQELQRVADAKGWEVVGVYEDLGISGSKTRDERPQLDFMLREATRRRFDTLAVWSVDRLGRSLQDLLNILQEIQGAGVDLYLHQQGIDTSTPGGRAMFQMLGVFAEFERAMIRERVVAGMARAKSEGRIPGRPAVLNTEDKRAIRQRLDKGANIAALASKYGVSRATIYRVRDEKTG